MKVAQSCLTLGDPRDYTVHGILQARTLEWLAFPSPEIRQRYISAHLCTITGKPPENIK